MRRVLAPLALALLLAQPVGAEKLQLTQRKLDVDGPVNVAGARKLSARLISLDAKATAPIHLMITATRGSAQGVMVLADTIRSLQSPVVAVVVTHVRDAGAALAPFADRMVMYPSAALVLTEVGYEGVEPPPDEDDEDSGEGADAEAEGKKAEAKEEEEPEPRTKLLRKARKRFLDRFHDRLAGRLDRDGEALRTALEEGGLVVDPARAVERGVASAVVRRIDYRQLPQVKEETKIITSTKEAETVEEPPDEEGEDEGAPQGGEAEPSRRIPRPEKPLSPQDAPKPEPTRGEGADDAEGASDEGDQ